MNAKPMPIALHFDHYGETIEYEWEISLKAISYAKPVTAAAYGGRCNFAMIS
jgi:hypothetical protein